MSGSTAEQARSLHPTLPFPLGRFTLCRELGAGGMATVYLSRMRLAAGLERVVALKTIHAHLAKEKTFVDMFLDEAKIASQISHPNVCSVFDFGEVSGTYFLAMEYLSGEPLIDVINAIAAKRDEDLLAAVPFLAARILADACEGLHAAHVLAGPDGKPLEVVHRDVSPQNLVVTYEGSVKVVDFGCAKALERITQTNTGMVKGKVSYAAPEQLRAEPLDARADIFALGVVLWEFLTLRQLFRRDSTIATAMAVLQEPIPPATEGCPWVPDELAAIAAKALARERDERYPSAREMGRALRGFIARSGVPFESAEVAEWMRILFGDRHEKKREMLAAVEALELSEVVEKPAPRALAEEETKLDASRARRKSAASESTTDDDEPIVLPTRTGRYLAAIALVLAIAGGAAYAYVAHGDAILTALGMTAGAPSGEPDEADERAASQGPLVQRVPDTQPGEREADGAARVEAEEAAARAEVDEATERAEAEEATAHVEANEATARTESNEAAHAPAVTAASTGGRRDERPRESAPVRSSSAPRRPAAPEPAPSRSTTPSPAPVQGGTTLDFSRGRVIVRAETGWALVMHEGRELGRTPLDTRLPVGTQRLRILPYGRAPGHTVEVVVEWGATARVVVPAAGPNGTGWNNPY